MNWMKLTVSLGSVFALAAAPACDGREQDPEPGPSTYVGTSPTASANGPSDGIAKVEYSNDSMSYRGEIPAAVGAQSFGPSLGTKPRPTVLVPPPTPAPVWSFDTGSLLDNPDANVAVSPTHVCVTTRAAIGCYTKSGLPVSLGMGLAAGPVKALQFFQASPGFTAGPVADCNISNFAKDGRIVYDPVHFRFFVVFQSREYPARLLIAVSKSTDPRDGWYTFADNLSTLGTTGADYQWIGINGTHLLLTEQLATGCGSACNGIPGTCNPTQSWHLSFTTANMITGGGYTRGVWTSTAAQSAVPAISASNTTDAFYVHRDDATHATVFAVRAGSVSSSGPITVASGGNPITGAQPPSPACAASLVYTNIARAPQNVEFRDNHLTWASNVSTVWTGTQASNAVHLGRFNVGSYFSNGTHPVSVEIDRIFGRSGSSDPLGSVFDYGWPAVASNSAGDVVVGCIRSSCSKLPELRGSVFFAGQTDISASVSLAQSDATVGQWHMAGAAADPSTTAVYLAQMVNSSGSLHVRVSKMLGSNQPDIIATQVTVPANVTRGVPFTATITVLNQGDAAMPASTANLRLSPDDSISVLLDPVVGSVSLPPILAGASTQVSTTITLASNVSVGNAFIGAQLDATQVASEYSEGNNTNSSLAAPHGNAPVNVH
jgi:hypothetical protein